MIAGSLYSYDRAMQRRTRFSIALSIFTLLSGCDRSATAPEDRVSSIALSETSVELKDGDTDTLSVALTGILGNSIDPHEGGVVVRWSSEDTTVVAVHEGIIEARHPGVTQVSASVGTREATAKVTVRGVPLVLTIVGDSLRAGVALVPTDSLSVRVTDRHQDALAGVAVEFVVTAGGGKVSPATALTNSQGIAQTSWTPGRAAGDQRVEARVAELPRVAFSSPITLTDPLGSDTVVTTPFSPHPVFLGRGIESAVAIEQVRYIVNGTATNAALTRYSFSSTTYFSADVLLPRGTHMLEVVVTDEADRVSRWRQTLTVRDLPARPYSIRFLGRENGDIDSNAVDLNDAGDVVGWIVHANGDTTAALWRGGATTLLGNGLGNRSKAVGISGMGEVVGTYRDGSCLRSFRWSDEGRRALEGCDRPAVDINDRGTILFGDNTALRDGRLIDLPASIERPIIGSARLNRGDAVLATDWKYGSATAGGYPLFGPLITRPPYTPTSMTIHGGGGISTDLNDREDVAGFCTGKGLCAGLIHLSDGSIVRIQWPEPPSVNVSAPQGAYAINNLRQVVGMASDGQSAFAYLWESDSTYRITLPDPAWTIDRVSEINERGEIAAHARNSSTGETRAVVLTPR
jgi:hypothetical protein